MFQFNNIIDVLYDEGLSACPLFYFDNFNLTNKVYLLMQKGTYENISFDKIYLSLKRMPFDPNKYFKINEITIWFKNPDLTCIRIVSNGISLKNEAIPSHLKNGFFHNLKLLDFDCDFIIFELSFEPVFNLIDGLFSEIESLANGFKIINKHGDDYKSIFFNSPNEQLNKIKHDKDIVQTLIENKLAKNSGRLKGIRSEYLKENVNLLLTPMLHGFEDITSLEKYIKTNLLETSSLKRNFQSQVNTKENILVDSFNKMTKLNKFKVTTDLQQSFQSLQSFYNRALVVNDILEFSYFSLLNIKIINQEDIVKILDFKRKLENALKIVEKKNDRLNDNNESAAVPKLIDRSSLNLNTVDSSIIPQPKRNDIKSDITSINTTSNIFDVILNKNHFEIQIKEIKTFDAFDFELFNDNLIVIINISHVFYQHLYKNSSAETKMAFNMMIGSICHSSHINISDKVRQQDKLFFSRWSEHIEDLLLGGN